MDGSSDARRQVEAALSSCEMDLPGLTLRSRSVPECQIRVRTPSREIVSPEAPADGFALHLSREGMPGIDLFLRTADPVSRDLVRDAARRGSDVLEIDLREMPAPEELTTAIISSAPRKWAWVHEMPQAKARLTTAERDADHLPNPGPPAPLDSDVSSNAETPHPPTEDTGPVSAPGARSPLLDPADRTPGAEDAPAETRSAPGRRGAAPEAPDPLLLPEDYAAAFTTYLIARGLPAHNVADALFSRIPGYGEDNPHDMMTNRSGRERLSRMLDEVLAFATPEDSSPSP